MLDWLFNGKEMIQETKGLLIAVGVILIIIITLKVLDKAGMVAPLVKTIGKLLKILLIVAILGSGAYSIIYINSYYKSEGGIYGKLTSYVYNTIELAKGEEDDVLIYDFGNLVFKLDEDTNKYTIVFTQQYKSEDHKTKFMEGTKYSIFVYNNDKEYECNDISYDLEWIHSEYSYVFYNSYQESDVIGDDTLTFDFCFYDNYSYLKITSNANESTIQLWNAYFNKYNFRVIIRVVDDVFIPEDFTETVDDGFIKINYYFNKELYKREVFTTVSTNHPLETHIEYDNYFITGWTDKKGNIIDSISRSESSNINLYAQYIDLTEVLTVTYHNYDGSEACTKKYIYGDAPDYNLNDFTNDGKKYKFIGWWTGSYTYLTGQGYQNGKYTGATSIEVGNPAITQISNSCELYPIFYVSTTSQFI